MNWTLLGKRLRAMRQQCNLTQEDLAMSADTSNIYICRIENGDARPTLPLLRKLCDVLGCPLSYMLDGREIVKYDKNAEQISKLLDGCSPYTIGIIRSIIESITQNTRIDSF